MAYASLLTKQIRLLTILPRISGSNDSPVLCNLQVVQLDKPYGGPEYTALSYTWGSAADYGRFKNMEAKRDRVVICNGQPVYVTQNLEDFLRQAEQTERFRDKKFWIDAICINQDDVTERGSQVGFMAEIYSSAESVICWLGAADEHTQLGFSTLAALADQVPDKKNRGHVETHTITPDASQSSWVSAVRIFQRTYFTRAWVIQEVVLAKKVTALCGPHELDWWRVIEKSSHFFSTTGWGARIARSAAIATSEADLQAIRSRFRAAAALRATLDRHNEGNTSPHGWAQALLYALIRSRGFKTTDPRDKIYSLLGLVEAYARDKDELTPIYAKDHTIAKTYIDAAVRILEDSDDLLLLSCVEGKRFQNHCADSGCPLPSWVPDWSCELQTGLRVTGYERYSASGALPSQKAEIDRRRSTITLRGKLIDEIDKVGEVTGAVLSGEPFPGWLDIFDAMDNEYPRPHVGRDGDKEDKLEAFWRTLIANTFKNPNRMIPKDMCLAPAFYEWLGTAVPRTTIPQEETTALWAERVAQALLIVRERWGDRVSRPLDGPAHDPQGVHYGLALSHANHLRLFITKKGYIGLGTECLEVGDLVWIVPGSRVPLILRKVDADAGGENSYSLVGGTYLHGFMAGEAFAPHRADQTMESMLHETEEFVLI